MKFMILVKPNPDLEVRLEAMSDSQMKASMAEMEVFNEALRKAGVLKDCDGLRLSREGKRVRFEGKARAALRRHGRCLDAPHAAAPDGWHLRAPDQSGI